MAEVQCKGHMTTWSQTEKNVRVVCSMVFWVHLQGLSYLANNCKLPFLPLEVLLLNWNNNTDYYTK